MPPGWSALAVPYFHPCEGGPFHGKTRQQHDAARRLVARARSCLSALLSMSVCPSVCLSVCLPLPVCLSVCLSALCSTRGGGGGSPLVASIAAARHHRSCLMHLNEWAKAEAS